ncbi:gluconate 2-dehydrogenase subunit 3 family protein [Paraburkholderia domus]|uniref:gluconate 2-dehydrogenase subunit 3 family protein n=2 Tax=Paraburkholderia domus TaxID=2793075 RepID=UPI001B8D21B6|nr:gluconate 2-dehydrogenase subunit 3 family protein [Paraburkholderia domus]
MQKNPQHLIDEQTSGQPSSSRRRFMFKSAALLPAAVTLTACDSGQSSPTGTPDSASRHYSPRYFSAAEFSFIHAAVARLIPSDDTGPGALELDVPVFIDRQMESEFGHAARWYMQGPFTQAAPQFGYQSRLTPREVYRLGIAETDTLCAARYGNNFAKLSNLDQDVVLHQLDRGELEFIGVDAKTFFEFLRTNTIEGYLADPVHGGNKHAGSWKMIGFPGARADYLDFVGQNRPYPYEPVGVMGKEN